MTEALTAALEDEAATQLARILPADVEVVDRPSRSKGIGGSDLAAILGLSRYQTPFDVYAYKLNLVAPPPKTEEMIMGSLLEPILFKRFADVEGDRVLRVDAAFRRKAEPFIVCNPDGITLPTAQQPETSIVEGKTRSEFARNAWGEPGSDDVPDEERIQAEYYCEILQVKRWTFPVLFGRNLVTFRGKADPDIGAELVDTARKFWNEHVAPAIPPRPLQGEAADAWLAARFPRHKTALREPTDDELERVRTWRQLRLLKDELERKIEGVANEIKLAIGDGEGLKGTGWSITWKKPKDSVHVGYEAALAAFKNSLSVNTFSNVRDVERVLRLLENELVAATETRPGTRRFNPSRTFELA